MKQQVPSCGLRVVRLARGMLSHARYGEHLGGTNEDVNERYFIVQLTLNSLKWQEISTSQVPVWESEI